MLSVAVAALLARPLLAPAAPGAETSPEQAIYRDQLAEVDRDLARGVIRPEEAERARTEIARRLLAADRAGPARLREAPRSAALAAVVAIGLFAVMGSLLVYSVLGQPGASDLPRAARVAEATRALETRPSQAEAEARFAELAPAAVPQVPAEELALIEELRRVVPTRPDEPEGWALLARNEARIGNFAAAAQAQQNLVHLRGDSATAEDVATLVDYLVEATGGIFVSPEAEAALDRLAAIDPQSMVLRYYAGLLYASTGRPDLAFPLWRAVVENGPPDDFRRFRAEAQIEQMAWLAGVDYTLPAPSGPSSDDMAAAADMDPEAQQQMIQGMVQGLRERLTAEGGPVEEWVRLVTSLAVLGDEAGARDALTEARLAFEGDSAALVALDAAAGQAGLAP
ncbi:c-type cytochrome biogenesis protein CcmI [Rubellimicrobium rubrum]|uniref:C-type cytochrome biogenesis protein CcmI n=2 Tax=Rubellimicrobium rubrum TaxID=2585369 RepID=A0A5C4N5P5_9RHOB|nr:c-type cytochrome biogenesis protein CcmI [Rubellimicrobium rubrum]